MEYVGTYMEGPYGSHAVDAKTLLIFAMPVAMETPNAQLGL